jgi:hypothetical protein
MSPTEQIAKLIRSGLGGTAEIIGRQMTSEELQTGGYVQGVHYDPVTLLMRALEQRFGELEEETRMAAANEFESFRKHQGESFEAFMCRYEISRERARRDGELEKTAEQCAQQIVRCLGRRQRHHAINQPIRQQVPKDRSRIGRNDRRDPKSIPHNRRKTQSHCILD